MRRPNFDENVVLLAESSYENDWNTHGYVYVWKRDNLDNVFVHVCVYMLNRGGTWDWPSSRRMRAEIDKLLKPLGLKRKGERTYHGTHGTNHWVFNYFTEKSV